MAPATLGTEATDGKTFARPVTVSAAGEGTPFYFVNPSVAIDDRRGWIYMYPARSVSPCDETAAVRHRLSKRAGNKPLRSLGCF